MPDTKNINARIKHKTDTTLNWNNATMIPQSGEIIVYSDSTPDKNRIKIGDGVTLPRDLPFSAASLTEVEDIRRGFDGTAYASAGEAVRNQGVKIETTHQQDLGENILTIGPWTPAGNHTEMNTDGGVITLSGPQTQGNILEQIKESTITPHVGYYSDKDHLDELLDENPDEAVYLTDACYGIASWVKGATEPFDFETGMVAGAILDLEKATLIGGIDITCRPGDGALSEFKIDVRDIFGNWNTMRSITSTDHPFYNFKGTEKYIFNTPIVGDSIRLVITDAAGDFPSILEVTVYEVKQGRKIKQITPYNVTVTGGASHDTSSPILSIIDGNRNTYYERYTKGQALLYTFDFTNTTDATFKRLSRLIIHAFRPDNRSPRRIVIDAITNESKDDNDWITILPKNYVYSLGFKDTFVLDFDRDYNVSKIRFNISSAISESSATLVLNEVDFYGPEQVSTRHYLGMRYDQGGPEFKQHPGDIWYLGGRFACDKCNKSYKSNVRITAHVSDTSQELLSFDLDTDMFEDHYSTFEITDNSNKGLAQDNIENLCVEIRYPDNIVDDKVCKITDLSLVNLTKVFGKGKEPSARAYYEMLNSSRMSIYDITGTRRYNINNAADVPAFNQVFETVSNAGYGGSQNDFVKKLIQDYVPTGYGWGETGGADIPDEDANNVTVTGVYRIKSSTLNVPSDCKLLVTYDLSSFIYQIAYSENGCNLATRNNDHGDWSEWLWINPPLYNNVEYCTTEKFNGYPVYQKRIAGLQLAQLTDGNTHTTQLLTLLGDDCTIVDYELFIEDSTYNQINKVPVLDTSGNLVRFVTPGTSPNQLVFTNKVQGKLTGHILLKYIKR